MDCSANGGLGSLATNAQKWSLTDIDYTATTSIALTASDTKTNRNIRLRTDDQNESSKNLYWNIAIPQSGVKGLCTGANTILITARGPVLDNESWVETGATLPVAVHGPSTIVIDGYIYFIGGTSSGGVLSTVYRASISDPESWSDTGATLPAPLSHSQAIIVGDYVYLLGGITTSSVRTNVIYRAPIANPTAWANTGATLPNVLYQSQVAIIDDYVYLFGGHGTGDGDPKANIYRAPVTNPLAWVDTGATLPGPLGYSQLVTTSNTLYLFGGYRGSGGQSSVDVIYSAPLSNPLNWNDTGSTLPRPLHASQADILDEYIYLFGGRDFTDNAAYVDNIYRASLNNPTQWEDIGLKLPVATAYAQSYVAPHAVYIYAGQTSTGSTDKIFRALIE